jgi:hypothetical protein
MSECSHGRPISVCVCVCFPLYVMQFLSISVLYIYVQICSFHIPIRVNRSVEQLVHLLQVIEFSCSILGPNASYCDEVRFFATA